MPENLEQLIAEVAARRADIGIALDGDADRIGLIDDKGRILFGDQLLVVLARDVLHARPGATIIADVKASQVLFDEIARAGGNPLMWRTGHSLIKAKMAETGSPLAGEMSGHIFFADHWYGFDDALYAAVRTLGVLARMDVRLSDVRDALPQVINTPEMRFDCDDTRKFAVIEEVAARLRAEGAKVSETDGVRVLTDDGWWLLRASNTQAVLVARAEAGDRGGARAVEAGAGAPARTVWPAGSGFLGEPRGALMAGPSPAMDASLPAEAMRAAARRKIAYVLCVFNRRTTCRHSRSPAGSRLPHCGRRAKAKRMRWLTSSAASRRRHGRRAG